MQMDRPLQVYLDSSDFSNLCRVENAQILKRLMGFSSSGFVEFRFSVVHILEGVAVNQQYLEASKARFEVMDALCGRKCLVPPFEVMRREAEEDASWVPHRDNGEWFPFENLDDLEIPTYVQTCRELLADSSLNRLQRRALSKQIFDARGHLTTHALKYLGNRPRELVRDFAERYPISEETVDLLLEAAMGRASKNAAIRALKDSILVLESFNDWSRKKWNEMRPVLEWLRKEGAKLQAMLESIRSIANDAVEKSKALGVSDDGVSKKLGELVQQLRSDLPGIVLRAIGVDASATSAASSSSLTVFSGYAVELTRASSMTLKNSRVSKQSDFGDLLHSVYLPHVDVYRTDGFAGALLRGILVDKSRAIVTSLESLPAVIEARLVRANAGNGRNV